MQAYGRHCNRHSLCRPTAGIAVATASAGQRQARQSPQPLQAYGKHCTRHSLCRPTAGITVATACSSLTTKFVSRQLVLADVQSSNLCNLCKYTEINFEGIF